MAPRERRDPGETGRALTLTDSFWEGQRVLGSPRPLLASEIGWFGSSVCIWDPWLGQIFVIMRKYRAPTRPVMKLEIAFCNTVVACRIESMLFAWHTFITCLLFSARHRPDAGSATETRPKPILPRVPISYHAVAVFLICSRFCFRFFSNTLFSTSEYVRRKHFKTWSCRERSVLVFICGVGISWEMIAWRPVCSPRPLNSKCFPFPKGCCS